VPTTLRPCGMKANRRAWTLKASDLCRCKSCHGHHVLNDAGVGSAFNNPAHVNALGRQRPYLRFDAGCLKPQCFKPLVRFRKREDRGGRATSGSPAELSGTWLRGNSRPRTLRMCEPWECKSPRTDHFKVLC